MNNPDVVICSHDNLRERKYKQGRDLLHLTVAGTSRLANNVKYSIAKSLDIQVAKKRKYDNDGRNDRQRYNLNQYATNGNRNDMSSDRPQRFSPQNQHQNNGCQHNGFVNRFG